MKKQLLFLFLLSTLKMLPQSGETDAAFGIDGKTVTGFGSNENRAYAIAFQPDGKFLVGGTSLNSNGEDDFALARYNVNGSLDVSFGVHGKVLTGFMEVNNDSSIIRSIHVLADGKIIVLGTTGMNGISSTVVIARYLANGHIDGTFGTNGKIITALASFINDGNSLIVQADGKIIVTAVKLDFNSPDAIGIERYTADGMPDSAFGTNGQVVLSFGTGNSWPSCIALKPDGKFVIAGKYPTVNSKIAVAQYTADGTLDTGFDTDGKVITSVGAGTSGAAKQLSIGADGKIKIAGIVGVNFALLQYNANGSLDTSFSGDGSVLTPLTANEQFYQTNSVAIQPDGKYLLVINPVSLSPSSDFLIRRYNADGTMDTSFGTGGTVLTTFGTGLNEAKAAAVLPNGKIVVAGQAQSLDLSHVDFAVAQYDSNGMADVLLDADGKVTTAFEKGNDFLSHIVVLPNDELIAVGTTEHKERNTSFYKDIVLSKYYSDGSPDTTFGNFGKVVSVFGDNLNQVTATSFQPGGKIILGNVYSVYSTPGYFGELIRYNVDGSLDATFGINGKNALNFTPSSIVFQADGKMIVAGGGTLEGVNGFIISRYNSNGTLDANFGTDGQLLVFFGQTSYGNASILIQPDNRIILFGSSSDPNLYNGSITLSTARINSNGSLDTTFGTGGKETTLIGYTYFPYAGTIKPDGKLIIAGVSNGPHFSTVRYNANGTIDPAYGTAGILTSDLSGDYSQVTSVLPQPDGKFLVALKMPGEAPESCDFMIKRFNADGTFDDDFGGQNGITTSFYDGYDAAFAVGLQSDNKVVVAGSANNGVSMDFALTRYTNTILNVDHFNNDSFGLVLYPNPVKDKLYIKNVEGGKLEIRGYCIYNTLGQLIYSGAASDSEVPTTNFSKGLYSILINTNNGTVSKKIIKQ
ncbi:T9SS type A sorting domain-containing protein [Flavobacterium subsaxonicum]|uniref:Secretion system C-terminal sorting domain-containing protein n=1 Tax=Flavobacterium subsaxonicum WB 4.1-42 = DSM 21790 TaxID=1121898 RepID=A0A0A2MF04_9FLAO|nr:T9SS type A sorting domain-containing protein [Flavobacterium subsaxonicum]KGO90874.1 hypothetical protein Q766_21050 [Flavobacterium subsaxonicum WB 4.1-42 = DSM 21790]